MAIPWKYSNRREHPLVSSSVGTQEFFFFLQEDANEVLYNGRREEDDRPESLEG